MLRPSLPHRRHHQPNRQAALQSNPPDETEIRSASVLGLPTLLRNLNLTSHHRDKPLPSSSSPPSTIKTPWETINSSGTTSTNRPASTIFPSPEAFPLPQIHLQSPSPPTPPLLPSSSRGQATAADGYMGRSHPDFSTLSPISGGSSTVGGGGGGGGGMPLGLGAYKWREEYDPLVSYLGDLVGGSHDCEEGDEGQDDSEVEEEEHSVVGTDKRRGWRA